MARIYFLLFCISTLLNGLASKAWAQEFDEAYLVGILAADSLYHRQEFRNAAMLYGSTFQQNGNLGFVPDRCRAASSWSMVGEIDSAFYHLFRIIERGKYDQLATIQGDSTMINLQKDTRWHKAIQMISANKEETESKYNRKLIAVLDTVLLNDQKLRIIVGDTIDKYGFDSPQVKKLDQAILKLDSLNQAIVINMLDHNGWPGPDEIKDHSNTLFLVIQHADLAIQQKYLPLMRVAVDKNFAERSALALLEDRIAVGLGECQIYGSQIGFDSKSKTHYVLPMANPNNVDQRRDVMDLEPLADYVKNWRISWNPYTYWKELRKLLGSKALKKYDCYRWAKK